MLRLGAVLAVCAASGSLASAARAATITVTSTADDGPGTLRTAIDTANEPGPDTIAFAIPGPGPHVIRVESQLPEVTGDQTTIDATTQPGYGSSPLIGTGGTVGVDDVALPRIPRPVVEIVAPAAVGSALRIRGALEPVVRGLHVVGGEFSVFVLESPNALVEDNVLGPDDDLQAPDPTVRSRSVLRLRTDSTDAVIRDNLIGFSDDLDCVRFEDASDGALVEGNEISGCGAPAGTTDDAIAFDESGGATISANLLRDGVSSGVATLGGTSGLTVQENTIRGNGSGGDETAAVSLSDENGLPVSGAVVRRNVITANVGPGVLVTGRNPASGRDTISENSIFANGLGIDLGAPDASTDSGDGATLNDPGDTDLGGNGLLNFPVLDTALSGSLVLSGWSPPGATIEFFVADPDPSGFGEGRTFIASAVEGGPDDRDAGASSYGPGPVNGLVQGSDDTNRFRFVLPSPPGVAVGTAITATATLGAQTSEFSGLATVARATADLGVAIAGAERAVPGSVVTYTVTVTNHGPDLAEASLALPTPPGLALVSVTGGGCASGFPCALGPLEPGDSRTITAAYRIDPAARGSITATASVTTAALDPESDDDSAALATILDVPAPPPGASPPGQVVAPPAPAPVAEVPGAATLTAPAPAGTPSLVLTNRAARRVVAPGATVVHTIVLRSTGTAPARDVRVCDHVPRALTRTAGRTVCRRIASLAPGATWRLVVHARAPSRLTRTVLAANVATARAVALKVRRARATVAVRPARRAAATPRFTG